MHEVLFRVHAAGRRVHNLSEMRGRDHSEHDMGSVASARCDNNGGGNPTSSSATAASGSDGMEMSGVRELRHGIL